MFNFLEGEFHRAWRTAPRGEALNLLLQEHASSLSFMAPRSVPVPRRWLLDKGSSLTTMVKNRLMGTIDDEFYEMILEDVIGGPDIPPEFTAPPEPETVEKVAA